MRDSFKQQLDVLVKLIFSPDNLSPKKVNGESLSCEALCEYFKAYMKIYQSEDLPEPKTALEATAEANNIRAKDLALKLYMKKMTELCGSSYIPKEKLEAGHASIVGKTISYFHGIKKMGGNRFAEKYEVTFSFILTSSTLA